MPSILIKVFANSIQQPTAFSLSTHVLNEVFDSPNLISSLSAYAYVRQAEIDDLEREKLIARRQMPTQANSMSTSAESRASVLFLRIFAAADYYTLDQSLMETVPPVLVDIILDPYLLNIFPASLLPTVATIVVVAIASWFISKAACHIIVHLATPSLESGSSGPSKQKPS